MPKSTPIESTGEILTIPERERAALLHIGRRLMQHGLHLDTLNYTEAALHCRAALDSIERQFRNETTKAK